VVCTACVPTARANSRSASAKQTRAASQPRFYVSFSSDVSARPIDGRVYVIIATTDEPEPRNQILENEIDPGEAKRLRQDGIRYRFAGMTNDIAKTATSLYEIFSRFNVHGGTMSSLLGMALVPTSYSCAFHNRSVEEIAKSLPVFKPILEMTAIELMDLVGHHGTRNKRINQAGACVLVWLNRTDPGWLERLQAMRQEFGLPTSIDTQSN
jgi:hypothetical protein